MKPSEIRSELLAQHADLRAKIDEVRSVAERRCRGGDGDLHALLVRLTYAVRVHNARAEELMRSIFPTLDAWGPIRASVMQEEHVLEHQELFAALVSAAERADGGAPASVLELAGKLVSHMDREEKVFLG